MAGPVPDRSVSVDGDALVTDGREIEMDRYTRRQYFEGLCRMRDDYGSLGADDTTSCISIEDVIALAIDLLEQPAEPATETNDAPKAA